MKDCYQLFEDCKGSLFIISAGDPEEADCLTAVTKNRANAQYILDALNAYEKMRSRRSANAKTEGII